MGQGHSYFAIGGYEVSDNNELLAYSTDTVSRRLYTLRFKNLKTGQLYPEKIPNTAGNAAWAADNQTVFYAKKDVTTLLPYQVYRHQLGTDPAQDMLVYEEKDDTFGLHVSRSKSRQYVGIELSKRLFVGIPLPRRRYPHRRVSRLRAAHPRFALRGCRIPTVDFTIFTNWEAPNFRVMAAPLASPGRDQWQEVIPQRADVFLEQMELFKDYLVLNERDEGLRQLRVINFKDQVGRVVDFRELAYTTFIGANPEFDTPLLRFTYTSFTTPSSTYDYDMATHKLMLRKEQAVLGGFDKKNYVTERQFVTARDGKRIPSPLSIKRASTKMARARCCNTPTAPTASRWTPPFRRPA